MNRSESGLTLVELLTVIAIVVILTALAVPANGWMKSGATTQFSNALSFAKSESMRLGTRVTICKSGDPTASAPSCDSTVRWDSGWIVFTDNTHVTGNTAGNLDGTDTVLKVGESLPGLTLTVSPNGFRNSVSFLPSGLVRGNGSNVGTAVFRACLPDKKGKSVTISPVGRIDTASITCP